MYDVQEPMELENTIKIEKNAESFIKQEHIESTFESNKKEIYSDHFNANTNPFGSLLEHSSIKSKNNFYGKDDEKLSYDEIMRTVNSKNLYNNSDENSRGKDYWLKQKLENELLEQLNKLHEDQNEN